MSQEIIRPSAGFRGADFLQLLAIEHGLNVQLRKTARLEWDEVFQQVNYAPVIYSQAMIDYQDIYYGSQYDEWQECSLVLYNDRKACAIWPLSISRNGECWSISSVGESVLGPLFSQCLSVKSVKSIIATCYRVLSQFVIHLGCELSTQEAFQDRAGLSEWYQRVAQGATARSIRHELYLDLTPDLNCIRGSIRKSYKPLISSGEKLWDVTVCRKADPAVWEEFRLLHLTVAGRVTRSLESWDAQLQAIAIESAFLVYLRDIDGRMVGGGLFHITQDEGLYAVAAYDRSLFDKPLGHVVQYHAIMEMKRRQVRWYKLGARQYPYDSPRPTAKELSISDFKQGFSSHLFPRLESAIVSDEA